MNDDIQDAIDLIENLKGKVQVMQADAQKDLDEQYAHAHEILKKVKEDTEVELYQEYEKRVNDLRTFMVNKIDQYLNMELTKMLEAFPDNAEQINAWKAANPPAEIVDTAMTEFEVDLLITDLQDQVSELMERNAELEALLTYADGKLGECGKNQVEIE